MEHEASVSSSRVEDSLDSPSTAVSDDETRLDMENTDRTSNGSESEQKPALADSDGEDDEPAVKKPRLEELLSTRSNEDVTVSLKEPKLIEDSTRLTKEVKIEIESDENEEDARRQSGSVGGSGDAVKKPRLQSPSTQSAGAGGRSDRQRNKSTSAAVLLGLVKSRVRKLAGERHEIAAKTSRSDTAVSSSSSDTALTAVSSLSATSNPKMKAPRGEC